MRPAVLLSVYWFLLLGGLGTFFPFYSLYLKENAGLDGTQVGLVMAVIPLVGMFAQPVWGHVADRAGSRAPILVAATIGAAAGFVLLSFARGFVGLLAATAMLAAFSTAAIPLCVSVSMALLSERGHHAFGFVRVWGTVGFLVTVVSLPPLVAFAERTSWEPLRSILPEAAATASAPALWLMIPATAVCYLAAALVASRLSESGHPVSRARRGEWRTLLGHAPFVRVLLFFLCAYLFLQGPMALFPIYIRSLGGDVDTVSRMWVVMLSLEIPLVALSGTGFRRLGARGLLAVGVIAGATRWLVSGLATSLFWIYAVQILHGVTVMGLIIGGPLYIDAVVPAQLRSTGQGMLSMIGVSLGGILSTTAAGWLVDHVSATAPAVCGGIGAAVLALILPWMVPPATRPAETREIPLEPVASDALGP